MLIQEDLYTEISRLQEDLPISFELKLEERVKDFESGLEALVLTLAKKSFQPT